ncbi:MAG: hypothetical protein KAH18_04570 [Psychromonas sp.]|nr:hypothetical protein [Psychromonas sp.]
MKIFFIVLLSMVAVYIPASYAENITVCSSLDSITTANPLFALNNKGIPLVNGLVSLPAPGKCVSMALTNKSREFLVGKHVQVMFSVAPALVPILIGTVTFDSVGDFDNCQVNIEYTTYIAFAVKARAAKGCLSKEPIKTFYFEQ